MIPTSANLTPLVDQVKTMIGGPTSVDSEGEPSLVNQIYQAIEQQGGFSPDRGYRLDIRREGGPISRGDLRALSAALEDSHRVVTRRSVSGSVVLELQPKRSLLSPSTWLNTTSTNRVEIASTADVPVLNDKQMHDVGIRLRTGGLKIFGSLCGIGLLYTANPPVAVAASMLGAMRTPGWVRDQLVGQRLSAQSNYDCGWCSKCAPMD